MYIIYKMIFLTSFYYFFFIIGFDKRLVIVLNNFLVYDKVKIIIKLIINFLI